MNHQRNGSRPSTVDESIARIRARCEPLETERVPLDHALSRTLREPVVADADQPPFDRSAMDGFAVRLDDRSAAFRVVDRIRAGDWKPRRLALGEAVQIATGGALPCDGLQVVMNEDVSVEGESITVRERQADRHIRFQGEDAKTGQVLVDPGVTIGPGTLSLLASLGCVQPVVTRMPSVLHIATGNEIVSPEVQPERGQIRDSNSTLVHAVLRSSGVNLTQLRIDEDREEVSSAIRDHVSAVSQMDLLLISGGASVGEHDFTLGILEEQGYTIHIHRTTTRPGKPMIFGSCGNRAAFGLPGNPLAHFVCLNLYVRQALWRFSGATLGPEFAQGVLSHDFTLKGNARETLWPARLENVAGEVQIELLRWQSSGDLTSLATANGLARIAPQQSTLSHGARVPYLPT